MRLRHRRWTDNARNKRMDLGACKSQREKRSKICCPYCNVTVRTNSHTRIFDIDSGVIKYHIFKCPDCFMPVIIGMNGKVIPTSQFLPFNDVEYLPDAVAKMYFECRKCFANECYHSVLILARTMIMHIAVDKGAQGGGKTFEFYVNHLVDKGFISPHVQGWVDKIRKLGNKYVHKLDEATKEDAELTLKFIMYLLIYVYQLPNEIGGA